MLCFMQCGPILWMFWWNKEFPVCFSEQWYVEMDMFCFQCNNCCIQPCFWIVAYTPRYVLFPIVCLMIQYSAERKEFFWWIIACFIMQWMSLDEKRLIAFTKKPCFCTRLYLFLTCACALIYLGSLTTNGISCVWYSLPYICKWNLSSLQQFQSPYVIFGYLVS